MTVHLDQKVIVDSLRIAFTGAEPPANLLEQLGGWEAVKIAAPALVNDPLLLPLAALTSRDAFALKRAGEDLQILRPAATAVANAILDTADPAIFASGVDMFIGDAVLSLAVGERIATRCLKLAVPPTGEEGGLVEASVLRRAVALEGAARLAVNGLGSKNKLLGLLEDVLEPQPRRYAQAVARTVAIAFDHWSPDDEVADVIHILTGVTAPHYDHAPEDEVRRRNEEFRRDIAPDAEWTLANIAVAKALRFTRVTDICVALNTATEHLSTVIALDDRDDAELLRAAVVLLRGLLLSLPTGPGSHDAVTWDIELTDARELAARAGKFAHDRHGLNHWSGDRKVAVLRGWSRLANDLAFLNDQLSRDSIYAASVVLDDITSIYSASRAYELTLGASEAQNIVAVIRPSISSGFASRAGLLRHLVDHTEMLKGLLAESEGTDQADDLRTRMATAEEILHAARANLVLAEPPGKLRGHSARLPPLLADFFGPTPAVAAALEGVPPEELRRLATGLADLKAATDLDPDLTVTAARKRILGALVGADDFRDEVVPAVTAVLDQLIKFVRQRLNSQESWKSYQFRSDANEHDLHVDLYEWLCQGQFGSFTNVEVQEVGAGRVDIQIQFSGFHLYLELKADDTSVPVDRKAAYIKQTVSYQAADVRIGFLVVLRMSHPKDKSPSGHLAEYVSHTTVPIQGSDVVRHIVMLEIPGNQTKPSSVR